MKFYIKMLEQDECLEIAKIANKPDENNLIVGDLLFYIPPDLFGKTHEVISISSCYEVILTDEDGDSYNWYVPPYFVEKLIPEDRIITKDIPMKSREYDG